MALINELVKQIEDKNLRERIQSEVLRINSYKKFGLVFENHLPECIPLYGLPIKRGAIVARKGRNIGDVYVVAKVNGNVAICVDKQTKESFEIAIDELVQVSQFGQPIYPQLIPMDKVENAPDSSLWHTLIEADNYHALQLLEYLYPQQVDCIYIDPPYNTGARDWKYNNNYVDSADAWRHSKWLSMMQKRLVIARRILNPDTGILIVTIDEHEVHHLRVLLEELFPAFYIQMVTSVINPKGVTQGRFSRVEEYLIYCFAPNAFVSDSDDNLLNPPNSNRKPRWKGLLRSGTDALRSDRESMFYPVLIDATQNKVVRAGSCLPMPALPNLEGSINGFAVAWPVRKDGSLGRWSVGSETLNTLIEKGYVACGRYDEKRKTWGISYISQPNQLKIDNGDIVIVGRNERTGVVEIEYANDDTRVIKTVWHRSYHDAGAYGTDMLSNIIGQSRAFSFPKSLYSERDALNSVLRNKSDALIVDFFAGSGTTLHAVNLLNAEDGGHRRCIIVTNNEVSEAESKLLMENGYQPGDPQWETNGIAQSVTWPRTRYSVNGKRDDGSILDGEYFTTSKKEVFSSRTIKKLDFVTADSLTSPAKKKQLVALLGKDKLSQSLIKANSKFDNVK